MQTQAQITWVQIPARARGFVIISPGLDLPVWVLGFLIYEMRVTFLNPQKAMEGGGFKPTSEILTAVTSCM